MWAAEGLRVCGTCVCRVRGVQAAGTLTQAALLGSIPDASIAWHYSAPLGVDVQVAPAAGCPFMKPACLQLHSTCANASSADDLVSSSCLVLAWPGSTRCCMHVAGRQRF